MAVTWLALNNLAWRERERERERRQVTIPALRAMNSVLDGAIMGGAESKNESLGREREGGREGESEERERERGEREERERKRT